MEELRKEPVTAGLILLNILVFLIVEFTGSSQNTMHMLDCGAAFTPMIIQGGEYYRLFTCMFLHFGIEHLLNNMLVLFVLGSRLEQAIGKIKFLLIYLIGGVLGNVISLLIELDVYKRQVLVWKAGWLRLDGIADKESLRLFLIVAVCGNLAGMAMTLTNGNSEIYQKGHRIEKSEDGAYTEELQVSVGDGKPEKVAVQIPEKETEETEAENAQAKQSPEEMRQKELKEVIEQYNREKQDPDYYYLPDSWDGQTLKWQKPGESTGTLLAALALFAAVVLMLKKTREQQEEMAKRAEQLLMDYPSLIMKFTLLIQAGMTVRRAFQKISSDYLRNCPKEGRYAYEAVTTTCHEMDSGVAELEAYRRFGERCGQMKYKTFSTILIQNLQKGGHRMADLLEKEALEAWDERKRKARVMGETAATKLLVPMIMMLAVVMAIIMIPAFLSFYG